MSVARHLHVDTVDLKVLLSLRTAGSRLNDHISSPLTRPKLSILRYNVVVQLDPVTNDLVLEANRIGVNRKNLSNRNQVD